MNIMRINIGTGLLLTIICFISACGGSGSSGFDSRAAAEQDAIFMATENKECVSFENTLLCAAEVDTITTDIVGPSSAPPLSGVPISLRIEPASGKTVPCERTPGSTRCQMTVNVIANQLPDQSQLFITSKRKDSVLWDAPAPMPQISSSLPISESTLEVDLLRFMAQDQLQIAVLLYLPASNPPSIIERPFLSDFSPDVVYVSTDLTLHIIASP